MVDLRDITVGARGMQVHYPIVTALLRGSKAAAAAAAQ